ncbi:hypothetical protein [Clostridium sp. B9]|uniref:hypothetical protein n=1 Tax=Clostridium sp. B9 TaxID=3423224 RepID=UPI003D2EB3F2
MNDILKSITEEEFKEEISIRFNNILTGFDNYSNALLVHKNQEKPFDEKEGDFINYFRDLLTIEEAVIVDFYIKNLDSESKERLIEKLEGNDKEIILRHINDEEIKSVYFKLETERLMDFITRLNTREQFFCSIYLRKNSMTIWGNYNLSFPMFFKDENILKVYEELANKNNLTLRDVSIK